MAPRSSRLVRCRSTLPVIGRRGLLDLPSEIRNQIYEMLLATPYALKETVEDGITTSSYTFHPALLRTNKQVCQEASGILYRHNMWIIACIGEGDIPGFHADVLWRFVGGKYNMDAVWSMVNKCPRACFLNLATPGSRRRFGSNKFRCTMMITGIERLPHVALWLHRHCAWSATPQPMSSLTIYFQQNLMPDATQASIVNAFLAIRGFRKVIALSSMKTREHKRESDRMSTLPRTVAQAVQPVRHFLQLGDEAKSLGHALDASQHYERGYNHSLLTGGLMIADSKAPGTWNIKAQGIRRLLNIFDHRWVEMLLKRGFYRDVKDLAFAVWQAPSLELTMTEKFELATCELLANVGLGSWEDARMDFHQLWQVSEGVTSLHPTELGVPDLDDGARARDIFGRLDKVEDKKRELLHCLMRLACLGGGRVEVDRRAMPGFHIMDIAIWSPELPWLSFPAARSWSRTASNMQRRVMIAMTAGLDLWSLEILD